MIRWVLGGMAILFLVLPAVLPGDAQWLFWVFDGIGATLLLVLLLFHSLRVWVGRDEHGAPKLGISYGIGLFRKTFSLSELRRAKRTKTSWLNGWGIHLTNRGWLYNISGFDAVELEFANKKRVQIGTDDPEGLLRAIEEATKSQAHTPPGC